MTCRNGRFTFTCKERVVLVGWWAAKVLSDTVDLYSMSIVVLLWSSEQYRFWVIALSITQRGVMKSLMTVVDLSVSPLISSGFCFMYFEVLLLGTHPFRMVCFLNKLIIFLDCFLC